MGKHTAPHTSRLSAATRAVRAGLAHLSGPHIPTGDYPTLELPVAAAETDAETDAEITQPVAMTLAEPPTEWISPDDWAHAHAGKAGAR